jgi:hypothetical protein
VNCSVKIGVPISTLTLLLATAPAAGEEARAIMSVTAIVVPASTAVPVSTVTAVRADERPLAEAEARLGAPVRRRGRILFTVRPASPAAGNPSRGATRYHTVTY